LPLEALSFFSAPTAQRRLPKHRHARKLTCSERLIAAWNEHQAARMPMLFSPTIGAVH
jgi:hypothetical protein